MVNKTIQIYKKFSLLNILHINLSTKYGGSEKNFVDTCNALTQYPFTIIAVVPKGTEYIHRFDHKVHIIELQTNASRYNPILNKALKKILQTYRTKIVHSHSAKASEVVYSLQRAYPYFKHFATKHNDRKGDIFNRVQYPIAVSKVVANTIKKENIPIIFNALNYQKPTVFVHHKLFTFVCVGRLDPIKQFDKVIQTIVTLPFECQILIAGEGPQKKDLEKLIQTLGVEKRVTLLGFVENIPSLLASCNVLIIASKSEGFSYSLLEGMMYAPVVISTSVGIAQEILPPKLLFDIEELSTKMLDAHTYYLDYKTITSSKKEQVIKEFSLESTTSKLIELYGETV